MATASHDARKRLRTTANAALVLVRIRRLGGCCCTLDVSSNNTVLQLKERVAGWAGVPSLSQRLLWDATELVDEHLVADLDGVDLQFLQKPMNEHLLALFDPNRNVREAAVQALDQLNLDPGVFNCLSDFLNEPSVKGIEALAQVAQKGDNLVMQARTAILGDEGPDVRRATVEALAEIAEKGDQEVVSVIVPKLGDLDAKVRMAAAKALDEVADMGNGTAITALIARLADESELVRGMAAMALSQFAGR